MRKHKGVWLTIASALLLHLLLSIGIAEAPSVDVQRLRSTFLSLVHIDSGMENEDVIGRWVIKRLREFTNDIVMDDAAKQLGGRGGNIIARIRGTTDAPPVLLNAHLDTVESTRGIKVVEEGDIIRTDGSTILGGDDKAGIAIILEVLRVLHEKRLPHPPIEVVFTIREEKGLLGAKVLDFSKLRAKYGFVVDGEDNPAEIIIQTPTHESFIVTIKGRSAHAGVEPEKGINAIVVAARAIAKIRWGRIDEDTTCNVGVIEGGRAINIVPDTCKLRGEIRSHNIKALDELRHRIEQIFNEEARALGATAEVRFTQLYQGFSISPKLPVVQAVIRALEQMGIKAIPRKIGGGSDANIFAAHGIQCVILATGASRLHTHQEQVSISRMHQCAQVLLRALITLASH